MDYVNIKHTDQVESFADALQQGLGRDRGLFFPASIPKLSSIDELLEMNFVDRSVHLLTPFVEPSVDQATLQQMIDRAFHFPVKLQAVEPNCHAVELFHGPSLAFKDFGARFLAECLRHFSKDPMTILTATSGDTGAAVAHAFYGNPNIRVVILYPRGRISNLQEKLFCTLGGNIVTVAVDSDFDECQSLVKQAFEEPKLRSTLRLNSANSINIGRLLAQICYYFDAVAQLPNREGVVVTIPSGNFGNLTAGLMARAMGLPIKRLVAATNANDTVPRYLKDNVWDPHPAQVTLSNAMDISAPNNFPRVQWLSDHYQQSLGTVVESFSISDAETEQSIRQLDQMGYVAEPHTALAYRALQKSLQPGEQGLFLGTAHPAKFKESIERITGKTVPLPEPLKQVMDASVLSHTIAPDFGLLQEILTSSEHRCENAS